MATTDDSLGEMTEYCELCETDTVHTVTVQLRTESTKNENAHYSREPYRMRKCRLCGHQESQRMNNA